MPYTKKERNPRLFIPANLHPEFCSQIDVQKDRAKFCLSFTPRVSLLGPGEEQFWSERVGKLSNTLLLSQSIWWLFFFKALQIPGFHVGIQIGWKIWIIPTISATSPSYSISFSSDLSPSRHFSIFSPPLNFPSLPSSLQRPADPNPHPATNFTPFPSNWMCRDSHISQQQHFSAFAGMCKNGKHL